ncbi:hypothetical protein KAJ61_02235 [Candidatus Parcubacteria bacterium]|nr:hypothetical protein [Candidatus Parcubacteria bacterium]
MKNKNLLKQNLLIAAAIVFCWIVGYFINYYDYANLWHVSFLFMLVYFPLVYIQYRQIIKKQDTKKINKVVNGTIWIYIFIFLLPLLDALLFELYLYCYYDNLPLYFFFIDFGMYEVKEIINLILFVMPYVIVIGLLCWSIKTNKQFKEV